MKLYYLLALFFMSSDTVKRQAIDIEIIGQPPVPPIYCYKNYDFEQLVKAGEVQLQAAWSKEYQATVYTASDSAFIYRQETLNDTFYYRFASQAVYDLFTITYRGFIVYNQQQDIFFATPSYKKEEAERLLKEFNGNRLGKTRDGFEMVELSNHLFLCFDPGAGFVRAFYNRADWEFLYGGVKAKTKHT